MRENTTPHPAPLAIVSDTLGPVSEINAQLAGEADQILVIAVPSKLTDEVAGPIRACADQRLPNSDGAALVLDCRGLELVNSIGITCLLQIQDRCAGQGARFLLAGLPPAIRRFLATLKLDERFDQAESVEDAIVACDG